MLLQSGHDTAPHPAEQSGPDRSVFCPLIFNQCRHPGAAAWNLQKFTEADILHHPDIDIRAFAGNLGGKQEHAFHRRQHDSAVHAMIGKPGPDGDVNRGLGHEPGNSCQRRMVLASISTGMPLLFTAQCLVKPVQAISPLSALVIR